MTTEGHDLDPGRPEHARWSRRDFVARSALLGLSVGAAGALLGACGGGDSAEDSGEPAAGSTQAAGTTAAAKDYRFALGFISLGAVWPAQQKWIACEAAKLDKGHITIIPTQQQSDLPKLITELNTWISQKVDAIIVLGPDAGAMAPIVGKAHESGVKVLALGNNFPGNDGFLSWASLDAGRMIGEHAANHINEQFGGTAEVALLTFDEIPSFKETIEGAVEVLEEKAPNAKIVANQKALLAAEGLEVMRGVYQANPNLNVVIACHDEAAVGAVQAFKATGRDPASLYIGSFNGTPAGLPHLLDPNDPIQAIAAHSQREHGILFVSQPYKAVTGENADHVIEYHLLTKDDPEAVQTFIDDLTPDKIETCEPWPF